MRFFYDTEFVDDGTTIDLISIGIVAEDGREYYACSTDADMRRAGEWVRANVLPLLPSPGSNLWKPKSVIAKEVAAFLLADCPPGRRFDPQLWAWVGGYDHVAYAQLYGSMVSMPARLPRFTHELKQYWEMAGKPKLPQVTGRSHDALHDARVNRDRFCAIAQVLPLSDDNAVQRR